MSKHLSILAAATISLALAVPAFGEQKNANTVVATVNDEQITVGHMITVYEGLPANYRTLPPETLFPLILDQLVQQTLLSQSRPKKDSLSTRLAIENERRALRAGQAVDALYGSTISDAALRQAYEQQFLTDTPQKEYNASHILVETKQQAEALIKQLDKGEDFARLAREHSTGPSGPNGGSLGWFGTGRMVPEFEAVVIGMKTGQVSGPVETMFGWHVIMLNETRVPEIPDFDTVRSQLRLELQEKSLQEQLDRLTKNAEITRANPGALDAAILSNTDLLENN